MRPYLSLAAVPAVLLALGAVAPSGANAKGSLEPVPLHPAQPSGLQSPGTLRPAQPGGLLAPGILDRDDFDGDEWKRRLTDADLDARMGAFDELRTLLPRQERARRTLEEWSQGSDELAWTSRLLLRQAPRRAIDPFERMRAELDALHGPLGGGLFGPGLDLDSLMGSRSLQDLMQGMGGGSQSSSVQISETPDGIRVEVTETKDGDESVEVYEASSREELLRQYPELEAQLGGGVSTLRLGMPFGGLRAFGGGAVPKDRLGVYLSTTDGAAGAPLMVQSVVPGTLADSLGVRSGDELIELDGRRLTSREDIAEALRARAAGDELRLTVIGSDGELRELVHQP